MEEERKMLREGEVERTMRKRGREDNEKERGWRKEKGGAPAEFTHMRERERES